VREADGLAMSSRSTYLEPAERKAAAVLYRALQAAQAEWGEGRRHGDTLRAALTSVLATEPLARVDYASAADPETFEEIRTNASGPALLLLAVRIGNTRLIDNLLLQP
jgi:pantoate--beta-alanine ligase